MQLHDDQPTRLTCIVAIVSMIVDVKNHQPIARAAKRKKKERTGYEYARSEVHGYM